MQSARTLMLVLLGGLVLSGCTGAGPERAFLGAGKVNPAGANHLIEFAAEPIRSKDLAEMICSSEAGGRPAATTENDGFIVALACFHDQAGKSPQAAKVLRNDVQHVIVLRSVQNCGLWKTYLQRGGAINRGAFNVLSVLTGGAGAVVGGQAASILSAASGAASGSGAAIDAAMLHGLAEGLIFPKVEEVRNALLEQMEGHQGDDLVSYSLMRALSDAVRFHAACNISTALSADAPAAEFGTQMKTFTTAMTGFKRATIAAAGATSLSPDPAIAADIKPGAIFLIEDGDVITVTKVQSGAAATTIDYATTKSGSATNVVGEALDAFSRKVVGSIVLRSGR